MAYKPDLAAAPEEQPETGSSFFIAPDGIPNADALEPGATFTFIGRAEDGRLEFESADEPVEEEESLLDGMKRTLNDPEEMKGQI